jgi:hypothetical protein
MFHIGQRVVCIRDSRSDEFDGPKKDEVCTIRQMAICPTTQTEAVRLVEYSCPLIPELQAEGAYRADRFRPAIERKTDTGFAVLEEIRQRESVPVEPRKPARVTTAHEGGA